MNSVLIAWLLLAFSVLAEVVGTVALKNSNGFTNLNFTVSAAASFLIAIWLMSISLKQIDMGITYAVWAGSATAILAIVGVIHYQESMPLLKIFGMTMVVIGVILLNLTN